MSPQSLNRKASSRRHRQSVGTHEARTGDDSPGSRDATAPTGGALRRAITFAIAIAGFLAGALAVLWIVPEAARQAVAGTFLVMTGVGLAAVALVQARAQSRASDVSARVSALHASRRRPSAASATIRPLALPGLKPAATKTLVSSTTSGKAAGSAQPSGACPESSKPRRPASRRPAVPCRRRRHLPGP